MKPINNWQNVKPATERMQLPAGGYICKIMGAEVKQYPSKDGGIFEKLEISLDILQGEYKDFYAEDYRSQINEDKRWRGVLRQYLPKDDGSDKDEWTKSNLKALTDAIEDSNNGYHWDWDEKGLKGKTVGCLFRREQWAMDGREGWIVRPFRPVPVSYIEEGDFKVPADKPLKGNQAAQVQTQPANAAGLLDDDDLPF